MDGKLAKFVLTSQQIWVSVTDVKKQRLWCHVDDKLVQDASHCVRLDLLEQGVGVIVLLQNRCDEGPLSLVDCVFQERAVCIFSSR